MPDFVLSVRKLNEQEIGIHMDPSKRETDENKKVNENPEGKTVEVQSAQDKEGELLEEDNSLNLK